MYQGLRMIFSRFDQAFLAEIAGADPAFFPIRRFSSGMLLDILILFFFRL